MLDQGQQQTFSQAILHVGADALGEVLLHHVREGVGDPVGQLALRQRGGLGRVQYREHREQRAVHER